MNPKNPKHPSTQHEKMDVVGGLVAGVSHEINTPLGVNIANCTLLMELLSELENDFQQGKLDAEKFHEFLNTSQEITSSMLKNMNRAAKLLSSFKRVAVKHTDEASQLEKVNLASLMQDFIDSHSKNSGNKSLAFEVVIPPTIEIFTYPSVLIQILTALTANTLVHGFSENKTTCTITLQAVPAGDGYEFTFSDDGSGIEEAELSKVFEPFYTTKRGAGNPGLGLSMVYNLVNMMLASQVYFESSPNNGFSVSFKLYNLSESQ